MVYTVTAKAFLDDRIDIIEQTGTSWYVGILWEHLLDFAYLPWSSYGNTRGVNKESIIS